MNAHKQKSDFGSRSKLAASNGIRGYQGTANQNLALLNKLQHPTSVKKPVVKKPVVVKSPVLTKAQQLAKQKAFEAKKAKNMAFYNTYKSQMYRGVADPKQLANWQNIQKNYKLRPGTIGDSYLQQMSIKALNGDTKAQAYLKAMHHNPMTGANLWKGQDPNKVLTTSASRHAYMKVNPMSDWTKGYDTRNYNIYNDRIMKNEAMTPDQMKWYAATTKKWALDNYEDPLVQNKVTLEKDKQAALNAQDTALNQNMSTMDRNNFTQQQALQQQMSNRGIGDSGIASDAYMRSQMAANANYGQEYAASATNKANLASQYDTQIGAAKGAIVAHNDQVKAAADKVAADKAAASQKQDEFLTTTTGIVWVGGHKLTSGGKPITTLEFQKLSETQRHNIATENGISEKNLMDYKARIDANNAKRSGDQLGYNAKIDSNNVAREGNQLDYSLGMDKNAVARQKIAADLEKSAATLKYNYAKLDLASSKVQADINNAKAKLDIMAKNASTSDMKARATSIGKQLSAVQSQINSYIKKGQKPPKSLGQKLEALQKQMSQLAGDTSTSGSLAGIP